MNQFVNFIHFNLRLQNFNSQMHEKQIDQKICQPKCILEIIIRGRQFSEWNHKQPGMISRPDSLDSTSKKNTLNNFRVFGQFLIT